MSHNRFSARVPPFGGEIFGLSPGAPRTADIAECLSVMFAEDVSMRVQAPVAIDPLSRSVRDAMVEDDLFAYQQAPDVQPIAWTPCEPIEPSPPVQYEAGLKIGPVEATGKGPSAGEVVGIVAALTVIGGAAWVGFRHLDRVLAASVR